jgi:galactokinase
MHVAPLSDNVDFPSAQSCVAMREAEFDAIAAAPGRVHLLGDDTGASGGLVLAVATPQRTRVAMRRNHGSAFTLQLLEPGESEQFSFDAPPREPAGSLVFGCLALMRARIGDLPPLEIEVGSDLPGGVGLASRAALAVATLRCLCQLLQLRLDDSTIAQLAHRAGTQYAQVRRGVTDALACSFAGTDHAVLVDPGSLACRQVPLPAASAVLVLDAGVPRKRAAGDAPLAGPVSSEDQRVLEAADGRDPERFGALMNASRAGVPSPVELHRLVALLQEQPGVYGARIAGPGGLAVALCKPEALQEIADEVLAKHFAEGYDGKQLVPNAPARTSTRAR